MADTWLADAGRNGGLKRMFPVKPLPQCAWDTSAGPLQGPSGLQSLLLQKGAICAPSLSWPPATLSPRSILLRMCVCVGGVLLKALGASS